LAEKRAKYTADDVRQVAQKWEEKENITNVLQGIWLVVWLVLKWLWPFIAIKLAARYIMNKVR